jgi:SAM-dependent methyltransferase
LEVGDDSYTRRFGGARVSRADVLGPKPAPGVTVVADLSDAAAIASGTYDCVILTQVLPFIFDTRGAVRHCHRILRPGGVLLTTQPGISQISRYDDERWGDFWRFTPRAIARLLAERFTPGKVTVRVYGNVRAATAFLYGLAAEELSGDELCHVDEDYPVCIGARAERA